MIENNFSPDKIKDLTKRDVTPPVDDYPLFAIDDKTGVPYLELGKPNPAIPFTAGPDGVYGRYTADSKITFEGKCRNSWEFMATGTGVSGLTVSAGSEITAQINHSATFDDGSWDGKEKVRNLGRLRMNWIGDFWPDLRFAGSDKMVRMEHDLQRSVIVITSVGGKCSLGLEIRAHKELDLFRVDILEETAFADCTGLFQLQMQKDYPFEAGIEDSVYLSWYQNRSGLVTGRCFGTAMAFDTPTGCSARWDMGRGQVVKDQQQAQTRYTLWIVPGSNANGFEAWRDDVCTRLACARRMGETFYTSHDTWWSDFWNRSRITFPGDDGSYLRHQAAFELYRYYMACSADVRRETPNRIAMELFRYNEIPDALDYEYTAFETYLSWYGAARTGDLDLLKSRLLQFVRILPIARRWTREIHGHGGCVIPYAHNFLRPFLVDGDIQINWYDQKYQENKNGNLLMLLLFCDYAELGGDERLIDEGLFSFAEGVITFFREHFPNRTAAGRIDFTPSCGQEAYFYVSDSAELLVPMKMLLPRLLKIGSARRWDSEILATWNELYNLLPDLPRSTVRLDPEVCQLDAQGRKEIVKKATLRLEESDLLAPARALNPEWSMKHCPQNVELDAIWPGRLVLRNPSERTVALRSYHARIFQHTPWGWDLDVVHAASLGLKDEVKQWWPYHFDTTFTFPCGLAQEMFATIPEKICITITPTMHGFGTGIINVLEMLMQDYPDLLIVLPCWEADVAVRYTLYSPYAGKVTVDYDPVKGASVQTERDITIKCGEGICLAVDK